MRRASLLLILPSFAHACTTFAVGKKATADGSVIVSHSTDADPTGDRRLVFVPAADHAKDAQRPIFYADESFPWYVGNDFGPDYEPNNDTGSKMTATIGFIPQVPHTYAYHDSVYGVMNEHGVAIGESTCSSMFQTCAKGTNIGCEDGRTIGEALMSVDTLTKLALERTKTAREAVQLMGDMATKYGFYGTQDDNGHGEALQVGDSEEAWTFNILADPTGKSAIWAAVRVPDDEVTVLANMFTLREIDVNDTANCMASHNVYSIAQERGWWKPGTPLDFTRVYSNGEYANKYYSGRRMWGGFNRIAKSLNLNPEYTNLRYDREWPWSAKPDKPVTPRDVMSWHREWYAGTQFDMTQGPAAGPGGSPDRFALSQKNTKAFPTGAWERSIAIYRTIYVHIQQLKDGAGVAWWAPGAAHYAPFLPVPSTFHHSIPSLMLNNPFRYDAASFNWASRKIGDVCQIRFDYMHKMVQAKMDEIEEAGMKIAALADEAILAHADSALKTWQKLADELLVSYSENTDIFHFSEQNDTSLGYTNNWLKTAGFANGPPPLPAMDQCPPKCSEPKAPVVV